MTRTLLGAALSLLLPGLAAPTPSHAATRQAVGYCMLSTDYAVYCFGSAPTPRPHPDYSWPGIHAVDIEAMPVGSSYLIVDTGGRVFSDSGAPPSWGRGFGTSNYLPAGWLRPGEQVTSVSLEPWSDGTTGGGWLFTTLGRVWPFGDAPFYGDMSGTALNGPVVGSIATPSGKGYYMVASDGGIFSFGDAAFRGSMGGVRLNQPVMALMPTPDGLGYWLVASDGGIFSFGSAPFRGSMGSTKLNRPVTGGIPYGDGYLLVASDGGTFDFSDQPFYGSMGGSPPAAPVVSVAAFLQ